MRILSKFKDYYDSISNIYGIDNKIVFDRTQSLPTQIKLHIMDEQILPFPRHRIRDMINSGRYSDSIQEMMKEQNIVSFKILSVCGKPFYIGQIPSEYESFTYKVISQERQIVISGDDEIFLLKHLTAWRESPLTSEPKRYLERLHKEAGSPIVMITGKVHGNISYGDHIFIIDEHIPNLSEIEGFAKIYPKEQIYQDISYWIANIMNDSPDVQPVGKPPQTDKEKILAHGLDLKKSFRHR